MKQYKEEVVEYCQGSVGKYELLISAELLRDGKTLASASGAEMVKPKKICRNEYMAVHFFLRAHPDRYGRLREEI